MRSILYISAVNTKRWINYIQRYESKWREELENIDPIGLPHGQISPPSSQSSARRRQCAISLFSISEPAANQDAPINKNSKSPNSRSLKQHTLAESISLCFCSCSAREIGRFIILICRYLSHRSRSRFSTRFSTRFSFSPHIFIFFFLAHLLLSNLSLHVYRICFDTFSVNHDQTDIWVIVNEFLRNVDR